MQRGHGSMLARAKTPGYSQNAATESLVAQNDLRDPRTGELKPLAPIISSAPAEARYEYGSLRKAGGMVRDQIATDSQREKSELGHLLAAPSAAAGAYSNVRGCYFQMPYENGFDMGGAMRGFDGGAVAWDVPQFMEDARSQTICYPELIEDRLRNYSAMSICGIFPEIRRAWFAIDSTLYLWDYGDNRAAPKIYDVLDQIITAVALVRPRRDVFVDKIEYLLVISTVVEVVVVGVEAGMHPSDPVYLHATDFSCPTDDIRISKIVGSNEGRVFMGGADGYLHELIYEDDGYMGFLFRPKCRKYNHTKRALSYLVPSFILAEDPIIDVAIDGSRNVLYTLSRYGAVYVYNMGDTGQEFKEVCCIQNVSTAMLAFTRRFSGRYLHQPRYNQQHTQMPMWIFQIHAIPEYESNIVCLMAVTQSGERVYFGGKRPGDMVEKRATLSQLHILHIREPPGKFAKPTDNRWLTSVGLPGMAPTGQGVSGKPRNQQQMFTKSFRIDRMTLLCDSGTDPHNDRTLALVGDEAHATAVRKGIKLSVQAKERDRGLNPGLCESVHVQKQIGRVWDVASVPPASALANIRSHIISKPVSVGQGKGGASQISPSKGRRNAALPSAAVTQVGKTRKYDQISDSSGKAASAEQLWKSAVSRSGDPAFSNLNILVTQWVTPAREVLMLTPSGVKRSILLQPVDQLARILENTASIEEGSSNWKQFLYLYGPAEFCAMCLTIMCCPKDRAAQGSLKPCSESLYVRASQLVLKQREPIPQPGIAGAGGRSGRHEGILLFMSRVLRPIWEWSVMVSSYGSGPPRRLGVRGVMDAASETLRDLGRDEADLRYFSLRFDSSEYDVIGMPLDNLLAFVQEHAGPRELNCEQLPDEETMLQASQLLQDVGGMGKRSSVVQQESHSMSSLYNLITRCVQALSALRELSNSGRINFPAIVFSATKENEGLLQDMRRITFEELVTTVKGARILNALLSARMSLRAKGGEKMVVMAEELTRVCPMFFGPDDCLRLVGTDNLWRASNAPPKSLERRDFLNRALRKFARACRLMALDTIDRGFVHEIGRICRQFFDLGYYDGILTIALTCAHHLARGKTHVLPQEILETIEERNGGIGPQYSPSIRGRLHSSPTVLRRRSDESARINLRIDCYNFVIEAIDRLLFPAAGLERKGQQGADFAATAQEEEEQVGARKESIASMLETAGKYQDRLFHRTLYTWLHDQGRPDLYEDLDSSYVEEFLFDNREDPSYLQSLTRYLLKRSRYVDAANICAMRAKMDAALLQDNPDLDQRILFFTEAINTAQAAPPEQLEGPRMSQYSEDFVSGNGLESLEKDLVMAREQRKILSILSKFSEHELRLGADERAKAILKLRKQLLRAEDLYNDFAAKHHLWGSCLSILHCYDMRSADIYGQVRTMWERIIRRAVWGGDGKIIPSGRQLPVFGSWAPTVAQTAIEIGKPLYNKGKNFTVPMFHLACCLERLVMLGAEYDNLEWVPTQLREVGADYFKLQEVYSKIFADSWSSLNSEEAKSVGEPNQFIEKHKVDNRIIAVVCHIMENWLVSAQSMPLDDPQLYLVEKFIKDIGSTYLPGVDRIQCISDEDTAVRQHNRNTLLGLQKKLSRFRQDWLRQPEASDSIVWRS